MSLTAYKKKRNFTKTPEPAGKVGPRHATALRYLIQKHDASRLHYDFRLELDGTLKSWAVPKGPSLDPARKSLAIQVEDHPLDYGDFEGVIPKGQYGGGTVLLWDQGTWEPLEDPRAGLARGKLRFALHGEKLKGEWNLVRMHGAAGRDGNHEGKNWLLIKGRDAFSGDKDILADAPRSVKTRRTLEQIAGARDDVWDSHRGKGKETKGARRTSMPGTLSPQLAVLAEHPPEGEEWIHEIKFDGYRLVGFIQDGRVRLRTRTGADWTEKFQPIARALEKLPVDSAIVDGEAVVLNEHGQSDFQALQKMFKSAEKSNLHYYMFDLVFFNGRDLRAAPLLERKKLLRDLFAKEGGAGVLGYSDHVRGDGETVIEKACALGSEGIVSKRVDAPYVSRRDPSWLKCKCTKRQEFVIIGFTQSERRSEGLRSILLGYHDARHRLIYGGRAGTGFDHRMLGELMERLEKLRQEPPPTDVPPPAREARAGRWVKPELVCEVRFTGWTADGVLRHPVFMGLRLDKPAEQVNREVAMKDAAIEGATGDPKTATKVAPTHAKGKNRASAGREKAGSKQVLNEDSKSTSPPLGVRMTHPDKILYPEEKITKAGIAAYYRRVAPLLLPHVTERPLALVRCPAGAGAKCFFARNWSPTMPPDVDKVSIAKGKDESHVMIHDLAGLLSLVQISALEIHTWNCKAADLEHPDQIIFDLDPGPGVAWKDVIKGAETLHALLEKLHMPAFVKTSGGKGLHITVPLLPTVNWEQAKSFCKTLAEHEAAQSDLFVTNMRKDLRQGKIYIDFQRNGRGATAVVPYGTRARAGAPVSMPIAWKELGGIKSAAAFTIQNAARHLEKRISDPWIDFEEARVDLAAVAMNDSIAR